MRAKRFSVEQIVTKLREAEKLQAQGLTIPQACKAGMSGTMRPWGAQTRSSLQKR
jgi:hypothetical protein